MKSGGEVKIIGGQYRRRHLSFPDLPDLRPTPNRIRETLFDWLQHEPVGAHCLDAFAGSGALGFEALSRGAASVVFLETDLKALSALKLNAKNLGITQIECLQHNALEWLTHFNRKNPFDLVFLDPPFSQPWLNPCLKLLVNQPWLSENAWVYLESSQPLDTLELPQPLELYRHKKAGQVYYGLLRHLTKD